MKRQIKAGTYKANVKNAMQDRIISTNKPIITFSIMQIYTYFVYFQSFLLYLHHDFIRNRNSKINFAWQYFNTTI